MQATAQGCCYDEAAEVQQNGMQGGRLITAHAHGHSLGWKERDELGFMIRVWWHQSERGPIKSEITLGLNGHQYLKLNSLYPYICHLPLPPGAPAAPQ